MMRNYRSEFMQNRYDTNNQLKGFHYNIPMMQSKAKQKLILEKNDTPIEMLTHDLYDFYGADGFEITFRFTSPFGYYAKLPTSKSLSIDKLNVNAALSLLLLLLIYEMKAVS